jgi:flagellar L-ring protein precursor FlgH
MRRGALLMLLFLAAAGTLRGQSSEGVMNRYIEESVAPTPANLPSAGSLYISRSYLTELARDPKAATVGDLITIRVVEQASALSSGAVSSSRSSAADFSVSKFLRALNAGGALANLAQSAGESSLEGQGSTGRQTSVTTQITGHVSHVMPNGNLIIEGVKEVVVNSERQLVWLRGTVRPVDLAPDNSVTSDRVAMMELRVDGKGVVNDAIRRPNIIYRILKGIFPF